MYTYILDVKDSAVLHRVHVANTLILQTCLTKMPTGGLLNTVVGIYCSSLYHAK